jgi:hypothetical protein
MAESCIYFNLYFRVITKARKRLPGFEFTGAKNSKLEYLYRFYRKNLAKVTGRNQFSLAMGHRTTAKVDDCTCTTLKDISVRNA